MYQRNISTKLLIALSDTPVVLLNGARQTGKSTLTEWIAKKKHPAVYYSLDNLTTLAAIQADPLSFIEKSNNSIILDEVQKLPELMVVIKEAVDKNRQPGRFLLTGSANVLLLPKISESLAGRMEIITLWPLSQGEIRGVEETFIDALFAKEFFIPKGKGINRRELFEEILIGGYPEARTRSATRRHDWFASYVTAILQRDIRELAHIEGLARLPNLLSLLATRAASLLNYAELSRTSTIAHTTLMRYLTLLQTTFLVHLVMPWSRNLGKRLVKAPKLFLNDTGLLSYLLNADLARIENEPMLTGMLMENFVANELKKQLTWNQTRAQLFHYRTQSGQEADFILENSSGHCVAIEVKASHLVTEKDFKGLQFFAEQLKDKFLRGIVLYTGSQVLPFGKNFYAVPVSSLWLPFAKH